MARGTLLLSSRYNEYNFVDHTSRLVVREAAKGEGGV